MYRLYLVFVTIYIYTAVIISRGRRNRNRLRRNTGRNPSVLQRPRRSRHCGTNRRKQRHHSRFPVYSLQSDVTEGCADSLTCVRQRYDAVRLSRYNAGRLRRVVPETDATVRDRPVEVHEHDVRRSSLRWIHQRRRTQQYERYVVNTYARKISRGINFCSSFFEN